MLARQHTSPNPPPPIARRLLAALTHAAKARGCYKVILDCSEANAAFYEKCGLVRKEVQMVRYLQA